MKKLLSIPCMKWINTSNPPLKAEFVRYRVEVNPDHIVTVELKGSRIELSLSHRLNLGTAFESWEEWDSFLIAVRACGHTV